MIAVVFRVRQIRWTFISCRSIIGYVDLSLDIGIPIGIQAFDIGELYVSLNEASF